MITRNIKSIGIELEGGLDEVEYQLLEDYVREKELEEYYSVTSDGSVYVGEKDIDNIEIRFWHHNLKTFFSFIKKVYELGFEQNSTCGNHVHFRFTDTERAKSIFGYSPIWRLFVKEYVEYANELGEKKWSKYMARLESRWCKPRYSKRAVIRQLSTPLRSRSRYKAINLNSFNLHGTLEIRILPYFEDYKEAKKSITWLIGVIDKLYSVKDILLARAKGDVKVARLIKEWEIEKKKVLSFYEVKKVRIDV